MSDRDDGARVYAVWDRPTRWFHWVNVACILALAALGLFILNAKSFGVSGDGKILLKTIHVYVGYVFAVNLIWRFVWGFFGNRYARWRAVLPGGKGYSQRLHAYVSGFRAGHPPQYLGHNPVASIIVAWLFLLMLTQAATGLVLAGTDLYMPPFGQGIAEWVAGSGEDQTRIEELKPGSMDGVDEAAYADMRAFRKPVVTVHEYLFYLLLVSIVLHVLGVVMTESRERSGLVSAMITGFKRADRPPEDSN